MASQIVSVEAQLATIKLLDFVRVDQRLHNDASLARHLQVAPPIISKLRNGRLALRSTIVLSIMECCGLTHEQLRAMLGESVWRDSVWNGKEHRVAPMVAEPLILYAQQGQAVRQAHEKLQEDGAVFIRAGQRSGKGLLAAEITRLSGVPILSIWSSTKTLAESQFPKHFLFKQGVHATPHYHALPAGSDKDNCLILIDEAMWTTGSYETFKLVRERGFRVLVISSRGPEFDRIPHWKSVPFLSFNTWDLNPNVTRESLQPHYDEDPSAAARDFEGWV